MHPFYRYAMVGLVLISASARAQEPQGSAPATKVTKEQFEKWMSELSNWGRWGKDDQLGAVNLITPAKRKQALTLAKTGIVISLAHPPLLDKAADARAPMTRTVIIQNQIPPSMSVVEKQEISFHGGTYTHLDALCHGVYNGKLYNGYPVAQAVAAGPTSKDGCRQLGIERLQDGVVTRAVLIDIPRLKGLPYLEPGTPVFREDVEAWEKKANVRVSSGDAILLRTGRWLRRAKVGPSATWTGFDPSIIPFLKERDIALMGSDEIADGPQVPNMGPAIHRFVIIALGANIIDNLDLERVAETAARLNRWEFLLIAAPVPTPQGTGSPINPLAFF